MNLYVAEFQIREPLVPGEMYRVVWDGVPYECEARIMTEEGAVLGNISIADSSDGGNYTEPFLIVVYSSGKNGSYSAMAGCKSEEATHTIEIQHIKARIKPLAADMLPQVYANGSTPVAFIDALNAACGTTCVQATLAGSDWRTSEGSDVISCPVTLDSPSLGPQCKFVYSVALSGEANQSASEAFAALRFPQMVFNDTILATGPRPEVDIPVLLVLTRIESPGFTAKQMSTPEPKPIDNSGGEVE